MANSNITNLTAAGALTGAEEVPIWQTSTKKTTVQDIANLATSGNTVSTGLLLAYSLNMPKA